MKVLAHGLTDKGLSRTNNDVSFYTDKDLGLFIVADGLGGQSAGEVASKMAVEVLSEGMGTQRGKMPLFKPRMYNASRPT